MESNHLPEKPRLTGAQKIAAAVRAFLVSLWNQTESLLVDLAVALLLGFGWLLSLLFSTRNQRRFVAVLLVFTCLVVLNYLGAPHIYGYQGGPVQSNYGWLGSFFGVPNGVTVAGTNAIYTGSDPCGALANAMNGTKAAGGQKGGSFNLTGYTGNQVCSPSNLTALDNALIATQGATVIQLGCPLILYLPLQSYAPATGATPLVGALTLTPWDYLYGCSPASVADNPTTVIAACTGTNLPVSGCTAPQTHEFPISSTSVSCTAGLSGRCYMAINSSGTMDITAGEPIHVNGGGLGAANLNITGAYRACEVTTTIAISSFSNVSGNTYQFTNTGTNGLATGGQVTLSGFTNIVGQTVTVLSAGLSSTTFEAVVTGTVGATSAGSGATGNPYIVTDSLCPFNPGTGTLYVPIISGALTMTTTAGSGGTYDVNLKPVFSGGGCGIEPTGTLTTGGTTVTGGSIVSAGKGCTSAPSCSVTDSTGTVGTDTCAVTVAATASPGMTCASTCGSILHGSIPLIELVDNTGTNGTATMASQVAHMIIDCRQVADCIGYRSLGANEHTRLIDINFAGMLERAFSIYTKQTNGMDAVESIRVIAGKLPNQIVPFTSSGNITTGVGGTTFAVNSVGTASTGLSYGLNINSVNACNYSNGTPIILYPTTAGAAGVYNYITGCSSTSAGTLGIAVSPSTTYQYYIPGCDAGTEAGFVADGGGHGIKDFTGDFSACSTQYNYPYTTAQPSNTFQLPNWGLRIDTYYFTHYILGGHTERSWAGAVFGVDAPFRAEHVDNWYGEPNCYTNTAGEFANRQCVGAEVFPEFWCTNPLAQNCTSQYKFTNISQSFSSVYALVDGNGVEPGVIPPTPDNAFNIAEYSVEWSALPPNNNLCVNVISSSPGQTNFGCGSQGYSHSGQGFQELSANSTNITATTAAAAQTFFTYTGLVAYTNYTLHCSGTFTQAATANGIGFAAAAAAPVTSVNWEVHGTVNPTTSTLATGSSGTVTNSSTATSIAVTGAPTAATQLPWTLDGSVIVGATAPAGFLVKAYIVSGSGTTTIDQNSYCNLVANP